MPTTYNQYAGPDAMSVYSASQDPCNYVTDNPCQVLAAANAAVERALQRVTERIEDDPSCRVRAWRTYQLARELASRAGHAEGIHRQLLCAQTERVVEAL